MSHQIGVYRYGLLPPDDWDEDCGEQLYLRNALWNQLVALDHEHRKRYLALLAPHPQIAPLEEQLVRLRERQAKLRAARKGLKAGDGFRANSGRIKDIAIALRELAREMQGVLEELKTMRKALRAEIAPQVRDLSAFHASEVRRIAGGSRLYWPNCNAVLASYDVARAKAMREGAALRFHPFTGEGAFNIQFIGGVSLDALEQDEHKMARLEVQAQPVVRKPRSDGQPQRRQGRPLPRLAITAYMRADGSKFGAHRKLTFPIILDRPLPEELRQGGENSRIQEIVITRRKVGTKFRWHAIFKFRLPHAPPPCHPHPGMRCSLNLGFRERPDGNLRIAMLHDGKGYQEILLNGESPCKPKGGWSRRRGQEPRAPWRTRLERDVQALRSQRDLHFDRMVAQLKAVWPERPQGCSVQIAEKLTRLLALPDGKRFASRKLALIAILWRKEHPQYWPQIGDALDNWRRQDKHWLEIEAHGRDRLLAARRDHYRRIAHDLAQEYAEIRIGRIDLKALARLEAANGQESKLGRKIRGNRQQAALYELQHTIVQEARKSGAQVIFIDAPYTPICAAHNCGLAMAVGSDLMVSCPKGHVWDQDEVAARNIYTAPLPEETQDKAPSPKARLTRSERMRATRRRKSGATSMQDL